MQKCIYINSKEETYKLKILRLQNNKEKQRSQNTDYLKEREKTIIWKEKAKSFMSPSKNLSLDQDGGYMEDRAMNF